MGFKAFVKSLFGIKTEDANIELKMTDRLEDAINGLQIESFAVFTIIDFIARILSKCQIKTYFKGKEQKGMEWFCFNYKPNKNQTAKEFWYEFYSKLLYDMEIMVFEVGNQRIIADDYLLTTNAVKEFEFENVSRDTLTFNHKYKMSDVIYLRYSNANVNSLLNGILYNYAHLIEESKKKFYKSDAQKGFLIVDALAQGNPNFEKNLKKILNNYFREFFKKKNSVIPLFSGMKYVPLENNFKRTKSEIEDFKALFDDAMIRAAQAYQVSPVIFGNSIEDTSHAVNLTITSCFAPLGEMVSNVLTTALFTPEQIINGNFAKVDTSNIISHDIFSIATNIDKLISSGFGNIDEVRVQAGWNECNEEWSQKHYITKNYDSIANVNSNNEGGENSNAE